MNGFWGYYGVRFEGDVTVYFGTILHFGQGQKRGNARLCSDKNGDVKKRHDGRRSVRDLQGQAQLQRDG